MVREFKLPDVGEGVAEGEIVSWLVEVGDTVSEDQPVAEVETDKAIVEVPSPVNGTVKEILAEAGEVVPVGNVIITFDVAGEEDEEPTESQEERAEQPDGVEADEAEGEAGAAGEAETAGETGAESEEAPAGGEGRVFAAPSARRLARELGVDIASVEGTGPSGRVTDQDVRTAAEGGAAESESEAEASTEAEEAVTEAEEPTGGAQPTTENDAQPTTADARDRTLAAPATRQLAEEQGVDLNAVPATEQRDGEAVVTPEAVQEYAESQQAAQAAEAETLAAGETGPREERRPFRGVRKAISEQMQKSKYTAPHVTHHDEVDVTKLVETRSELKPAAEEQGIRLTYMPFIMKAVTAALKEFPEVNSSLDEENDELVLKNYYNVGIATATDAGLMVPVVDDVDKKGMLQLASEMNEVVEKARDRTISLDEMQGGTFTITNFGVIGGEYATPIINYPEVAILGLGELKQRPQVVDSETPKGSRNANSAERRSANHSSGRSPREDGEAASGEVVARYTLPLSLSIDHRVIDGAVGAAFTNKVMEYLKNPNLLLLE